MKYKSLSEKRVSQIQSFNGAANENHEDIAQLKRRLNDGNDAFGLVIILFLNSVGVY